MVSGPAGVLRREVLPLFRTRLDVSRWSNVGLYAEDARLGLGQLEDAAADDGAAVVVPVLREAITAVTRVYRRARDGYGEIQLLVQDLLALHAGCVGRRRIRGWWTG